MAGYWAATPVIIAASRPAAIAGAAHFVAGHACEDMGASGRPEPRDGTSEGWPVGLASRHGSSILSRGGGG
ncbi:MAG TPA: hypothetical protein PKA95_07880, partial [Thermomicrobiales bacterium]|nr:hypothetical protein [Thermomicrobiales bacterium]